MFSMFGGMCVFAVCVFSVRSSFFACLFFAVVVVFAHLFLLADREVVYNRQREEALLVRVAWERREPEEAHQEELDVLKNGPNLVLFFCCTFVCSFVLSVYLFIGLFVCLFVRFFVCLFVCCVSLFACLVCFFFVCLFVCLFICLFVCFSLFISLFVRSFVYLFVRLFVRLFFSINSRTLMFVIYSYTRACA